MPLFSEAETTRLGPVEAIQQEVWVKPEDCLKYLDVTTVVRGGAYGGLVSYQGECEVKESDDMTIVFTETYSKTFNEVTVTGNAKGYSIKVSFVMSSLHPDRKALKEMASSKILAEVRPMSYTVNGIRTLEKISR